MSAAPEFSHVIDISRVREAPQEVVLSAHAAHCRALAERFDLVDVLALSVQLTVRRGLAASIRVVGTLEARVRQLCVLSGEPFEVTITEDIDEIFMAGGDQNDADFDFELAAEVAESAEFVDDGRIDLGELSAQILGVSLDPYARAPGAVSQTASIDTAPPEKTSKTSPFADLATRIKGRG